MKYLSHSALVLILISYSYSYSDLDIDSEPDSGFDFDIDFDSESDSVDVRVCHSTLHGVLSPTAWHPPRPRPLKSSYPRLEVTQRAVQRLQTQCTAVH